MLETLEPVEPVLPVLPRLLSPADDDGDPDRRRLADAALARRLPNPRPKLGAS